MRWLRDLIDRWRRGPELRARQALVQELERQLELAQQENVQGARAFVDLTQQRELLLAFVRSGHVKARCRAPGCGNLSFDFELRRVEHQGAPFLAAICGECARRLKREQQGKLAAAEAAATPHPIAAEA